MATVKPLSRAGRLLSKQKKFVTALKKGDPVMVLVGGNRKKQKAVAGQTGKILRFIPKRGRVVVEGVNFIKRHKRKTSPTDVGGVIQKEGSVHISNVMYYVADLKRPVRLHTKSMENGRKVRGYMHPESKAFEQIDV